ncbi:hypothetical protein N3K66_006639 [Trichothecium roseum]|uniref:Uncharacterized protein n=1 Tax=Trichothecium roseum TaxID=47278 RepID=A0ACC0UW07_9HYPO|nr:hypothetical protein N3K66_006639 [Trichothecium roseum]
MAAPSSAAGFEHGGVQRLLAGVSVPIPDHTLSSHLSRVDPRARRARTKLHPRRRLARPLQHLRGPRPRDKAHHLLRPLVLLDPRLRERGLSALAPPESPPEPLRHARRRAPRCEAPGPSARRVRGGEAAARRARRRGRGVRVGRALGRRDAGMPAPPPPVAAAAAAAARAAARRRPGRVGHILPPAPGADLRALLRGFRARGLWRRGELGRRVAGAAAH